MLTLLVSLLLGWVAGPVVLIMFRVRSWPYHEPVLTFCLAAPGSFAPGTAMPSPGLGPDDIGAVPDALEILN